MTFGTLRIFSTEFEGKTPVQHFIIFLMMERTPPTLLLSPYIHVHFLPNSHLSHVQNTSTLSQHPSKS